MSSGDSSGTNERLDEAIRDFLDARERGEAPSPKELLARHPDVATELAEFLANYEAFRVIGCDPPSPLTALSLQPGERLGDYEILEEIGRGGMGVVFKARQVSLDRIVALKLILAGQLASAEESERFRREATAAARLDHPHIVSIHSVGRHSAGGNSVGGNSVGGNSVGGRGIGGNGIGEHGGLDYYSMRYVEGETLSGHRDRLHGEHRSIARILETTGRAVDHAHARGVLHRDLKPGNILIDLDGQPHVADFGLAKGLWSEKGLTRTGAALGTPSYMAPEQASAGGGRETPATDVYGMGAILYELLTGLAPFRGKTSFEILEQVKMKEPLRPRALDPSIPLDLESICLKCLEKEPRRRYASAGDFADDLRRFLEGKPVRARRITVVGRAWRTCRRRPVVTGLAASIVFAQLILAAGLWRSGIETEASLWRSYLERARAGRRSGLPGQRVASLAVLENAAAIRVDDRVRDEAISCMSRVDAVPLFRAPLLPEGVLEAWRSGGRVPVAIDGELRRFARGDADGGVGITVAGQSEPVHVLPAAGSPVSQLGFSPDGGHIAVRHADGRLRVWVLGEKDELRIELPAASPEPAWDFGPRDFGPEGREFAAGTADGRVAFHDLFSGVRRATIGPERRADPVLHLRFRPDGAALAVCRSGGGSIEVWNTATGRVLKRFAAQGPISEMAWQPDGERLAVNCGEEIRLLCLRQRESIVLSPRRRRVERMGLDPRGAFLASSDADGLRLWSVHSGRELLTIEGQALLGFSSDGGSLATIASSGELAVWKLEAGAEWGSMVRFRSNAGYVYRLSVHPGSRLVAATTQQGAWIIDLASGRELARVPAPGYSGGAALFTPRGDALLTWGGDGLQVWPIATEEPDPSRMTMRLGPPRRLEVAGQGKRPGPSALAADDRTLAVIADTAAGRIVVLDWRSPGRPIVLEARRLVEAVALSPDGRQVASGAKLTGVLFWDLRNPKESFREMPLLGARWMAFSPDGRKLIVGAESEFTFLDTASWTVSHRLHKEVSGSSFGALSAASNLLAVCDSPASLKLLHPGSGGVLASFATPEPYITRLCFDPSGRWLVVTGRSACLFLLDLERVRERLGAMGIDPPFEPFPPSRALEDPRRLEVIVDVGKPGK